MKIIIIGTFTTTSGNYAILSTFSLTGHAKATVTELLEAWRADALSQEMRCPQS